MLTTPPRVARPWVCPTCRRQFERRNQGHSCRRYALAEHFKRRPVAHALYDALRAATTREVGRFRVESLPCCIHFVSTFTFAAVRVLTDRIRVDFTAPRPRKSRRVHRCIKMSAHRYLCLVDVTTPAEIDDQLLAWIRAAHDVRQATDPAGAHVGHRRARSVRPSGVVAPRSRATLSP